MLYLLLEFALIAYEFLLEELAKSLETYLTETKAYWLQDFISVQEDLWKNIIKSLLSPNRPI
ncbi:hypothetical protein C2G38_2234995 [Gigaspora rosea]|uniref:Uncharacterized protein n=1 Tax=Gigaspora rosea TaxID=44941 RepID=A0A397TU84_9GLOM|nr:hypothetical protein C2G38_2234995 [Gigaspora rosea]